MEKSHTFCCLRNALRGLGILLALFLTACPGSGSGSDKSGSEVDIYGISGEVFGLSGSGLVLENNGGDALPISSDGPFVFPTELEDQAPYDVTVQSQPTSPDQICTVTNGTGVVNGTAVTDVAVQCRSVQISLTLEPFASGLTEPLGIAHADDDRLFVVEKPGVIRIVRPDGSVDGAPFLDISNRVGDASGEGGLLGLTFHPDYENNRRFFVNYTQSVERVTRISSFRVSSDPDIADPDSEDILLTVSQPFGNHNAGALAFGPDGYLYIPLGDGGSGGDPNDSAQNRGLLLGKMSRIDVDLGPGTAPDCVGSGSGNYRIPDTNPFVDGTGGTCDEVWALGFRNPWRFSFDRLTGDLYIGDVGQGDWEEIDYQPADSAGGENYGWRCYEGNHPFNTAGCGPAGDYTAPIFEYDHGEGCSVTGGYVYRGDLFPELVDRYVLTDYCSGNFWDLLPDGSGTWIPTMHTNLTGFGYVSFGEDNAGELYAVNIDRGTLERLQGE